MDFSQWPPNPITHHHNVHARRKWVLPTIRVRVLPSKIQIQIRVRVDLEPPIESAQLSTSLPQSTLSVCMYVCRLAAPSHPIPSHPMPGGSFIINIPPPLPSDANSQHHGPPLLRTPFRSVFGAGRRVCEIEKPAERKSGQVRRHA